MRITRCRAAAIGGGEAAACVEFCSRGRSRPRRGRRRTPRARTVRLARRATAPYHAPPQTTPRASTCAKHMMQTLPPIARGGLHWRAGGGGCPARTLVWCVRTRARTHDIERGSAQACLTVCGSHAHCGAHGCACRLVCVRRSFLRNAAWGDVKTCHSTANSLSNHMFVKMLMMSWLFCQMLLWLLLVSLLLLFFF